LNIAFHKELELLTIELKGTKAKFEKEMDEEKTVVENLQLVVEEQKGVIEELKV
jgi:hypothetical protein